jgi:hypothetical protein
MKFLTWLLWIFPKVEGDGGTGDAGDAGTGDAGGGGDGDSAGDKRKPIGGDDPQARPDWLADKFWNPDLKAPRTELLGKAYNELEGKIRDKTEHLKEEIRLEMIASAPEKYAVNLSEDLNIPDNVELDFTEDDPLVSWFFGVAKEQGMSQETVDKMLNQYVALEISRMPDIAAEIGKLGDHGQDRLLRVHNWLESKLSDTQFVAMNPFLNSAAQVEAMEVLMKSSGPADFEADSGGAPLTLAELREMQSDPRYHREKNPAFIQKVADGYKRLYKGQ